MTRLVRAQVAHVPGWTGPLYEDAEPDAVEGMGALDDGLNLIARPGGLRVVRGGSSVALTLSDQSDPITDVLGLFPFAPSGAVAIAHAAATPEHYGYVLAPDGSGLTWALNADEGDSSGALTWASATPARPLGVELFEKLYVVDATESSSRQAMVVIHINAGALVITNPTYDLNQSGGGPGGLKAYAAEVFNGVLFASGYDHETAADAPHLLRHSLLGTDPASASGFDPNAYAIIGAKGQRIRALRSGRTILLVAKQDELYAISGAGRALPGWQYQIQQVSNTRGAGCTNPHALDHALGMWYGLGEAGPWRSDGSNVELLRAGRDRSWSRIDSLALCQVKFYPERRQVHFGTHRTGLTGYGDALTEFWCWDVDREQWDLSHRYRRSFHMVSPVSSEAVAPDTAVGAPVQSMVYGETQLEWPLTRVWGTFAAGDLTAQTQVWRRTGGGATALAETLPAGVQRFTLDSLGISSSEAPHLFYVKLRHIKGGVPGEFSTEIPFYGPLRPPLLTVGADPSNQYLRRVVTVGPFQNLQDVYAESLAPTAGYSKTWAGVGFGNQTDTTTLFNATSVAYEAWAERTDWPSSPVDLRTSVVTGAHCAPNTSGSVSAPRQVMGYGLFLTDIYASWGRAELTGGPYVLEYRVLGSGSAYTTAATSTQYLELTQVTGLAASTAYEFRVRNTTTATTSASVTMYTRLAAPTVAVVSDNLGTPSVTVTVTTSQATTTVRVYNADQTYDTEDTGVSAGAHPYTSTEGFCGIPDRYFARCHDASWPTGHQFSDAAFDDVTDPCST